MKNATIDFKNFNLLQEITQYKRCQKDEAFEFLPQELDSQFVWIISYSDR